MSKKKAADGAGGRGGTLGRCPDRLDNLSVPHLPPVVNINISQSYNQTGVDHERGI